jgi:hypothetical protein
MRRVRSPERTERPGSAGPVRPPRPVVPLSVAHPTRTVVDRHRHAEKEPAAGRFCCLTPPADVHSDLDIDSSTKWPLLIMMSALTVASAWYPWTEL